MGIPYVRKEKKPYLLAIIKVYHEHFMHLFLKNDKIHKNYVKLFLYSLDFPKRPSFVCPMSVEQRNSFSKCIILSSFMNHGLQSTTEGIQ